MSKENKATKNNVEINLNGNYLIYSLRNDFSGRIKSTYKITFIF